MVVLGGDTIVYTRAGIVEAKKIVLGDPILGANGKYFCAVKVEPTKCAMVRVATNIGTFDVGSDTLVRSADGATVAASKLAPGDIIYSGKRQYVGQAGISAIDLGVPMAVDDATTKVAFLGYLHAVAPCTFIRGASIIIPKVWRLPEEFRNCDPVGDSMMRIYSHDLAAMCQTHYEYPKLPTWLASCSLKARRNYFTGYWIGFNNTDKRLMASNNLVTIFNSIAATIGYQFYIESMCGTREVIGSLSVVPTTELAPASVRHVFHYNGPAYNIATGGGIATVGGDLWTVKI